MIGALGSQVGGSHYLKCGMQPYEFTGPNGWDGFAHAILKYLTRWPDKGGLVDLEKAKHLAHLRVELNCEIRPNPLARELHQQVPMSDYIRANGIMAIDDPVFYALELWVMAGRHGANARAMFFGLLDQYIGRKSCADPTPALAHDVNLISQS